MILLLALVGLLALGQAATIIPVDSSSSSVNVKNSGQDYSYVINKNHGIAIEPFPHHEIPVIKVAPDGNAIKQEHIPLKDHQEIKPIQSQMQTTHQVAGVTYTPVAVIPAYTYLPIQPFTIPYVNYPYNFIATL